MKLTAPLFSLLEHSFSLRDLILIFGGIFLVMKASEELIEKTTPLKKQTEEKSLSAKKMQTLFLITVLQIGIMDIIFSLDSVITAVGMVSDVKIMAGAIIIAMAVMLFFSEFVGQFIKKHAEIQILGLAILVMIGGVLTAEGFGHHFPKMFIYAAMGFAFLVDVLQIQHKKHHGN
jgi:predicted tellurium resistance membrane protein TerC